MSASCYHHYSHRETPAVGRVNQLPMHNVRKFPPRLVTLLMLSLHPPQCVFLKVSIVYSIYSYAHSTCSNALFTGFNNSVMTIYKLLVLDLVLLVLVLVPH